MGRLPSLTISGAPTPLIVGKSIETNGVVGLSVGLKLAETSDIECNLMRLGDLGGPLERATQIVIKALKYRDFTEEIGSALDGNRTCNLRFRRPMLYPVELQVHLSNAMNIGLKSPEVNAVALYIGMKPAVNAEKAELIRGVDDSVICTDWNDF